MDSTATYGPGPRVLLNWQRYEQSIKIKFEEIEKAEDGIAWTPSETPSRWILRTFVLCGFPQQDHVPICDPPALLSQRDAHSRLLLFRDPDRGVGSPKCGGSSPQVSMRTTAIAICDCFLEDNLKCAFAPSGWTACSAVPRLSHFVCNSAEITVARAWGISRTM